MMSGTNGYTQNEAQSMEYQGGSRAQWLKLSFGMGLPGFISLLGHIVDM